jgi:hypothetical protein
MSEKSYMNGSIFLYPQSGLSPILSAGWHCLEAGLGTMQTSALWASINLAEVRKEQNGDSIPSLGQKGNDWSL